MGGEKTKGGGPEKSGLGSPPRGRGKVGHSVISTISSGITPAWAGKSLFDMVINSLLEDHPRVGGEKSWNLRLFSVGAGSPPRGRGKGKSSDQKILRPGITPAWAGKSFFPQRVQVRVQDHPRVGGEKGATPMNSGLMLGSPPRGRGKAELKNLKISNAGITPAWAGKRYARGRTEHHSGDHPRVGGEKPLIRVMVLFWLGSPPRGRGKDGMFQSSRFSEGITPAWAGKRLKRSHRSGIFISGPIPFHSVLHRPAGSGGSRAGRDGSPAGQPQNTGPA